MGFLSGLTDKISGFAESFNPLPSGQSVINGLTGQTGAEASLAGAQLQYKASQEARDQLERLNKPYLQLGNNAVAGFQNFLDPAAQQDYLNSNPIFQAALNNTSDQLKSSAAAQGKFNSGGLVNALFNNYLSQGQSFINNRYNQLYQPVQLGQNSANFQGSSSADLLTQGGNALAAGGVGAANSYSQGASNVAGIGALLASFFSDENLKEDMTPVSKDFDGTTNYLFRYAGSKNVYLGKSAQEVAAKDPKNALLDASGYLKVTEKYNPVKVA